MELADHLETLRRQGGALAATPAAVLERNVPSCPDWTVGQLVGHTGWVHRWVNAVLRADPASPPSPKTIEAAPSGEGVLRWYREALEELLVSFEEVDLGQTFKTFAGPRNGQWWARRMAHEAAMHHWDAQNATGNASAFDPAFAADGVDEALDTYFARRFDHSAFGSNGQTMHLHATDGSSGAESAGEWMLTMHPDGVRSERAHGKGDVALRGSTSDLLLFVMGRVGPDRFEIFGDASLAQRWQAAAKI